MFSLTINAALHSLVFVVVFWLVAANWADGQRTPTGTTSGYILDPHGLAGAGAKVIVDSPTMRATRGVTANGQGAYDVPTLMPGHYNLATEANRFKTINLDGAAMEVSQLARMHFALRIGSESDGITVLGSAPLLNTSDPR